MNKHELIKLLQDFGIITNNRLETGIHLALVLPFIATASVIYGVVWLLFMNDTSSDINHVYPENDEMDSYEEHEMHKHYSTKNTK